mmetsp:Transcript_780/g.1389  ORF Transcript_780/g.1389 Transcript_780/m.1389 type:complete len:380 (+) Transcript_780:703-1842(+)
MGGGMGGQRKPQYHDIFENTDVQKLDLSSVFKFYRRQEIWVILFYDVSKQESRELKQEYTTLAEKMFGILQIGAIDCHDEEELCEEFSVYDTPLIKIFTENAADDGEKFTGKKTWQKISGAAANKMQNFVRVVNEDNYEQFLEEEPSKNKILYFTERKSTAPLFKSLSKTYKDKLVFGEIRSSEKGLFKKYGIEKTPALIAVTDGFNYQGEKYDTSEMKIDQLKKFLSTFAYSTQKVEKKVELHHLKMKLTQNKNSGVCGRKTSNLCLILFLKGKGQGLLDLYMPLLDIFKNDPVTLTYVHASEEPYMRDQFGIQNGLGAVIYKPKRAKYLRLDKALDGDLIDPSMIKDFIDDALGGGGSWQPVKNNNDNGLLFKEFVD